MHSNEIQRLAVGRKGAARMIDVCPRTISNLNARGDLPFVKCGRRILIPVASLERFIRAREHNKKS